MSKSVNGQNVAMYTKSLTKQLGLSLVELMISVTLSLVIMVGVIQLYASASRTSSTAEGVSRIQENIRYTINHLGNNIARAGNMGCFSFSAAPAPVSLGAGHQIDKAVFSLLESRLEVRVDPDNPSSTDPNDTIVVDQDGNVSAPNDSVWFDFENSFISGDNQDAIGNAAVLDGTDTLIVKFADATAALKVQLASGNSLTLGDVSSLSDDDVVFAGNCRRAYVFELDDVDDGDNTVTVKSDLAHSFSGADPLLFLYAGESGAHRYFIGGDGCTSAGNGRTNCSLFRTINGGDAQELVQGIHGMQVTYGYEGSAVLTDTIVNDRRTIDRIQVTLNFNAVDAGNVLTKDVTHLFAVRNQL